MSEDIRSVLTELLRLYNWRRAVGTDITKQESLHYGREKKAAWDAATRVLAALSAIDTIESGPFKGLPKPHKVPEGYVMVDEKSFKIILGVLTEEQTHEVCMKEAEHLRVGRSDGSTAKP